MATTNAGEQAAARPGTARPDMSDGPTYSIRFSTGPNVPCACGRNQVGSGPVGYRDEQAICDLCMVEQCTELGLVLALIAVVRAFAVVDRDRRESWLGALAELDTFARVYELVAAKTAPLRIFRIPDTPLRSDGP